MPITGQTNIFFNWSTEQKKRKQCLCLKWGGGGQKYTWDIGGNDFFPERKKLKIFKKIGFFNFLMPIIEETKSQNGISLTERKIQRGEGP